MPGTVARWLLSCCMMKLTLPGTLNYFAPHQIANEVTADTEIAIHGFRDCLTRYGRDPGCAALFIDARNAFNEIDCQKIHDDVIVHAPVMAQYVQWCKDMHIS